MHQRITHHSEQKVDRSGAGTPIWYELLGILDGQCLCTVESDWELDKGN